jgi:transcription initiation protein SPT3
MMYVSGETAEASIETTGMIEEIVRQQVIEMVCPWSANRTATKHLTNDM